MAGLRPAPTLELLVLAQIAATADRQIPQLHLADADAFQSGDLQPDSSHMRRIWRFLPSRSTKRSWSSFCQVTLAGLRYSRSSFKP